MDEGIPRDPARAGTPPGWDYNPSTWKQRLPIVAIALAAFGIAVVWRRGSAALR
jgi:hypothetical protein